MNDPDTTAAAPLPDVQQDAAANAASPAPAMSGARHGGRRDAVRAALVAAVALFACSAAYLAFTVPGPWLPRAGAKTWAAKDLGLVRGAGRLAGDELVVTAADANGIALVNVTTDFRSSDFAGVQWLASGLPDDADVRLLWHTDVQPGKLNEVALRVSGGRATTAVIDDRAWIGRITGLALAVRGTLPQPVRIAGVVARPMGALDVVRDRIGEWLAFEPWNGASINTVTGGDDDPRVPLPAALALVVALAGGAVAALRRWKPAAFSASTPVLLAALFLAAWLALDARWTWNLVRQERATAAQYAGKDARERHLASEDGALYAFVEKALAVMPKAPVRVFVAADADYFRGRAAYHLYPHNVYFTARGNALPKAAWFRPGDWLLVYQRRGMQFDKAQGRIRFDDGETLAAEARLVEPGAALFVIR
jgi:hypothetical protein